MSDVSKPGSLYRFGMDLWGTKGKGMLISGGCDQFGAVDFPEHTFSEISKLKEDTGLLVNLHCGLVDEETVAKISRSGVDKVSFDLVYDDDTIHEVLGLERSKEDYLRTITRLKDQGVIVVPHILAGLDKGRISWEFEAVKVLASMEIDEMVLIILIPTKGTPFESIQPPAKENILELAVYMRTLIKGRILLGCMRPKGMVDLEKEVLDVGFDGIVLPSKSTMIWMKEKGWKIHNLNICCCM
jgi:uncharacterized radical SAM superfamily protein